MPEKKNRRLAAVMFTDIAGYTALMQRDEKVALAHLQKFRQIMETQVPAHGGQIIQFYGDGCLTTFQSSVEAMTCARIMQESFLQEPRVPARIGLHSGDVVFRDGNVYGDAVNVAARVESMGVPGAVLLSSTVRNQIKNKPEFELKDLGRFAFKNVEKEMTVYALVQEGFAIPKRKEMQGKGKPAPKKRPLLWAVVAAAVVILASILLWQQNKLWAAENDFLATTIRQERVVVIPFDNNTGVTDLDDFGYLTAALLANGLTEADVKTCSPRTVLQYQHLIGVLPNNPEGKTSFSEVTGARYWIEGYFLMEGDSLTIKSQLTDGWSGDVVRNFPDVKGHTGQKELLADRLCRRIMGFWAAQKDIEKGKFKPPLYEAYQEYRKIFQGGTGYWSNAENDIMYGRRAFEKDATFYLPALQEMFWQAHNGALRTDTLIALLDPHYDEMTSFEQALFNANKACYERDYDAYGKWLGENIARFPRDPFTIHNYSFNLAFRENRPAKAWEIANRIKLEQLDISPDQKAQRIGYRAVYGLAAGHFEEVIDLVDTYPRTKKWLGLYFSLKSKALIRSGQLDALDNLSKEVEVAEISSYWYEQQYDLAAFCNEVGEEFLLLNQPAAAQKWLNKTLKGMKAMPGGLTTKYDSLHLAKTYYLLGRYQESLKWGKNSVTLDGQHHSWIEGRYLATIGAAYARLGQKGKAEAITQLLIEGHYNMRFYNAAQVCAELGDMERAMDFLNQSKETTGIRGMPFDYAQFDYLMRNLFGYGPFEALVGIQDEVLN